MLINTILKQYWHFLKLLWPQNSCKRLFQKKNWTNLKFKVIMKISQKQKNCQVTEIICMYFIMSKLQNFKALVIITFLFQVSFNYFFRVVNPCIYCMANTCYYNTICIDTSYVISAICSKYSSLSLQLFSI